MNGNHQTDKTKEKTESQQKKTTNKFNRPIVADGVEITVKQLKTADAANGTDKSTKSLYGFKISGKNMTSDPNKGIGAIDFVLKTTDGKVHQIDDTVTNFGKAIEEGQTVSGNAYFSIDKDQKVAKLQYKPSDKVLISWPINN